MCCVTGTLKEVLRDKLMPWNPDSESITVRTYSIAGSNEAVGVYFYDKYSHRTGGVFIFFDTQIWYFIVECMNFYVLFPDTLPTETQKTWEFACNYTEQRVVLHCNGVQVLNFVLSDSECTESNWRDRWRKSTQLKFSSIDTASNSYCISSKAGK